MKLSTIIAIAALSSTNAATENQTGLYNAVRDHSKSRDAWCDDISPDADDNLCSYADNNRCSYADDDLGSYADDDLGSDTEDDYCLA
uniref:Secreted protein n=1 Tax=Achlya hypogyna TaxID=1202772 RepID=A0A0A7CNX5_ACHHY|nr:secreted protein [Achlya hypogyna]